MKLIVAGGRDFTDYKALEEAMWDVTRRLRKRGALSPRLEIVSGTARGADRLGEQFAENWCIPLQRFPADWDTHGKRAGPIRNIEMAKYSDVLLAFWDGDSRGTEHMIETALRYGLEVHVYKY